MACVLASRWKRCLEWWHLVFPALGSSRLQRELAETFVRETAPRRDGRHARLFMAHLDGLGQFRAGKRSSSRRVSGRFGEEIRHEARRGRRLRAGGLHPGCLPISLTSRQRRCLHDAVTHVPTSNGHIADHRQHWVPSEPNLVRRDGTIGCQSGLSVDCRAASVIALRAASGANGHAHPMGE